MVPHSGYSTNPLSNYMNRYYNMTQNRNNNALNNNNTLNNNNALNNNTLNTNDNIFTTTNIPDNNAQYFEVEYEIPIYRSYPVNNGISLTTLNNATTLYTLRIIEEEESSDESNTDNINQQSNTNENDEDEESNVEFHHNELECAICRNNISNNQIYRCINYCGHRFHQSCIDTWLSTHETCPLCRYNLNDYQDDTSEEQNNNLNTNN